VDSCPVNADTIISVADPTRVTYSTLLVAVLVATSSGGDQPGQARRPFGLGRCGPIDQAYVRTSTETGGQPFPLAPSEIAQMGVFLAESSRSDSA
jgi:hypothetical protein